MTNSCKGCKHLIELENGNFQLGCNPLWELPHQDCLMKYIALQLYQIRKNLQPVYSKEFREKFERLMGKQLDELEEGDSWKE
jgi:hypothetical protein